eukprot:2389515-Prymnesium_polylepis.1
MTSQKGPWDWSIRPDERPLTPPSVRHTHPATVTHTYHVPPTHKHKWPHYATLAHMSRRQVTQTAFIGACGAQHKNIAHTTIWSDDTDSSVRCSTSEPCCDQSMPPPLARIWGCAPPAGGDHAHRMQER